MQSEIFGEFFRAATPGQSGERGLGLGLYIVESFALLLNHPISLRSAPGRGSTFEINVPVATVAFNARPTVDVHRHVLFGQGLCAAVTDSDPIALEATVRLLRSWGFKVEGAASPADLEKGPFDFLIADHDPEAAGDGLAAIATMQEITPDLRVILVTGELEALPQDAAFFDVDMLCKPVPPVALCAAVAKTAAQSASERRAAGAIS